MPRGGPRQGSGRKRGQRTKDKQEIVERAAATGMLPHDLLCLISQGHTIDGHVPTFAERMAAAAQAAPFFASKLATIDNRHSGGIDLGIILASRLEGARKRTDG